MQNCSFCGRQPVIHQRYSGVYRCDRCFTESVKKRFRQTITKENMVSTGDRVAVAVSGGKDSVSLMHLLADFSTYKDVELVMLSIDEGISGYRDESLQIARENSKELGVNHVIVSFEKAFGATLDQMADELGEEGGGPDACTHCGILRRSLLNQAARELGASKLATAHNLDDEVQTIVLNYIRGDLARLSRLNQDSNREGFVPRVKPLREIPEKEITIYAVLKDFGAQIAECPYIGGLRSEVRSFVNGLEVDHPTTKFKILRMFDKLKPHLPDVSEGFELKECKICGEPTPRELCRVCELLEQLGLGRRKKKIISN